MGKISHNISEHLSASKNESTLSDLSVDRRAALRTLVGTFTALATGTIVGRQCEAQEDGENQSLFDRMCKEAGISFEVYAEESPQIKADFKNTLRALEGIAEETVSLYGNATLSDGSPDAEMLRDEIPKMPVEHTQRIERALVKDLSAKYSDVPGFEDAHGMQVLPRYVFKKEQRLISWAFSLQGGPVPTTVFRLSEAIKLKTIPSSKCRLGIFTPPEPFNIDVYQQGKDLIRYNPTNGVEAIGESVRLGNGESVPVINIQKIKENRTPAEAKAKIAWVGANEIGHTFFMKLEHSDPTVQKALAEMDVLTSGQIHEAFGDYFAILNTPGHDLYAEMYTKLNAAERSKRYVLTASMYTQAIAKFARDHLTDLNRNLPAEQLMTEVERNLKRSKELRLAHRKCVLREFEEHFRKLGMVT